MTPEQLIALLNQDLALEYRAALLYQQHAAIVTGDVFDFSPHLYEHADDEMEHAKKLAEHINYLGGIPVAVSANPAQAFENYAMLQIDLDGENEAITRYKERIRQCMETGFYGTVAILLEILQDEEAHANDLQARLSV